MAADANPAEHLIATVAPVGGTDTDWPRRWRESEEAAAILREIDEATGGTYDVGDEDDSAFATSYFTQCKELIKRNFRAQYRMWAPFSEVSLTVIGEGSYYTTKLFVAIYFGVSTFPERRQQS
jgi:ATP-binding cassette subfamily G (WHITE) protein 2 (SNQ2)